MGPFAGGGEILRQALLAATSRMLQRQRVHIGAGGAKLLTFVTELPPLNFKGSFCRKSHSQNSNIRDRHLRHYEAQNPGRCERRSEFRNFAKLLDDDHLAGNSTFHTFGVGEPHPL